MMKTAGLHSFLSQHPMAKRVLWVLFAIVFYLCGERFTVWLVEPKNFHGGIDWLGVILFPVMLALFFMSGRYLGCATGHCDSGQCDSNNPSTSSNDSYYQRPPGL